jgi:vacuolar-type H+-ATPase subunit D/Vma8
MLHFGADINLMEHKIIPTYQNNEKYNGVKDFCLEREKRRPKYDVSDKYIDDYV